MKHEFELKAALADGGVSLRCRMLATGWRLVFEGDMCDRRYDTPDRSLEGRDEVLRVRRMTAAGEHRMTAGARRRSRSRLTGLPWRIICTSLTQARQEPASPLRRSISTLMPDTTTSCSRTSHRGDCRASLGGSERLTSAQTASCC